MFNVMKQDNPLKYPAYYRGTFNNKKTGNLFLKSRLPVSTIMARHLPQKRMCLISYYYLSSLQNHLRQPEQ